MIKQIRIIHCEEYGRDFANIVDGSVHNVLQECKHGVMVMGDAGKRVLIFNHEYEVIKEE